MAPKSNRSKTSKTSKTSVRGSSKSASVPDRSLPHGSTEPTSSRAGSARAASPSYSDTPSAATTTEPQEERPLLSEYITQDSVDDPTLYGRIQELPDGPVDEEQRKQAYDDRAAAAIQLCEDATR